MNSPWSQSTPALPRTRLGDAGSLASSSVDASASPKNIAGASVLAEAADGTASRSRATSTSAPGDASMGVGVAVPSDAALVMRPSSANVWDESGEVDSPFPSPLGVTTPHSLRGDDPGWPGTSSHPSTADAVGTPNTGTTPAALGLRSLELGSPPPSYASGNVYSAGFSMAGLDASAASQAGSQRNASMANDGSPGTSSSPVLPSNTLHMSPGNRKGSVGSWSSGPSPGPATVISPSPPSPLVEVSSGFVYSRSRTQSNTASSTSLHPAPATTGMGNKALGSSEGQWAGSGAAQGPPPLPVASAAAGNSSQRSRSGSSSSSGAGAGAGSAAPTARTPAAGKATSARKLAGGVGSISTAVAGSGLVSPPYGASSPLEPAPLAPIPSPEADTAGAARGGRLGDAALELVELPTLPTSATGEERHGRGELAGGTEMWLQPSSRPRGRGGRGRGQATQAAGRGKAGPPPSDAHKVDHRRQGEGDSVVYVESAPEAPQAQVELLSSDWAPSSPAGSVARLASLPDDAMGMEEQPSTVAASFIVQAFGIHRSPSPSVLGQLQPPTPSSAQSFGVPFTPAPATPVPSTPFRYAQAGSREATDLAGLTDSEYADFYRSGYRNEWDPQYNDAIDASWGGPAAEPAMDFTSGNFFGASAASAAMYDKDGGPVMGAPEERGRSSEPPS